MMRLTFEISNAEFVCSLHAFLAKGCPFRELDVENWPTNKMTFRATRCCAFLSMAQLTNSLTPVLNRLGHRHANILAIIGRQSKVCVTYETAGLICCFASRLFIIAAPVQL